MCVEHISPGPERWQKANNKQTILPNIKKLRFRGRDGASSCINTEQKGGRIIRGMSRWVKKGSVSIKLGLEEVQDSANESEASNQLH